MLEDRGPQITLEVVNAFDMKKEDALLHNVSMTHGHYDMRVPIIERAHVLLTETRIPITARLAGVFAIDFAIENVSKQTAVSYIIESENILEKF